MRHFEPPHDNVVLTDAVKLKYINEAIKKTAGSYMIIQFV